MCITGLLGSTDEIFAPYRRSATTTSAPSGPISPSTRPGVASAESSPCPPKQRPRQPSSTPWPPRARRPPYAATFPASPSRTAPRQDVQERGREARAAAHASPQGTPPGAGRRLDLTAARTAACGHGFASDRRTQPHAPGRRLRHAAAALGACGAASRRSGNGSRRVRYRARAPRCTSPRTLWRWCASGSNAAASPAGGYSAPLCRGVLGAALDPSQIPRIYKGMARRAGLPPDVVDGLPGHSTGSAPRSWPDCSGATGMDGLGMAASVGRAREALMGGAGKGAGSE